MPLNWNAHKGQETNKGSWRMERSFKRGEIELSDLNRERGTGKQENLNRLGDWRTG